MVEILHYEKANKNKTIGYVDIRVPITKPTVLIFRKVAHVQSGSRKWFSLPTFSRENGKGESSFIRFCEFETKVNNEVLMDSLSEEVKEFCKLNGIEIEEGMDFGTFPEEGKDQIPF